MDTWMKIWMTMMILFQMRVLTVYF